MSHQTRSHVFVVFLTVIVLISSVGSGSVYAAPSQLPVPSSESTTPTPPTPTSPKVTPTPTVQAEAEPQAWLDGAIDLDQFPPQGTLVVRFNTPMSPESSPNPVLSWPAVEGISSWDDTRTVLTFRPAASLDSRKTYTFFLDSSLRSVGGDALADAPEWIVHVQSGPRVVKVSPEPGALEQRYQVIEVQFDREMKNSVSEETLSIEPPVPAELRWKDKRVLKITLQQPLEPDQRYDLTLNGGNDENAVFAADGTYFAEDYRWFYWQKPFEARVNLLGEKSLAIKFNYLLDREKSGLPFTISPTLDGEWKWSSSQEIRFIAKEVIPASQEYTLNLAHALVDSNGFEVSTIPALSFSGLPPLRLANRDLVKVETSDYFNAQPGVEALRIEFDVPVDHASVEKAFTIEPKLPGTFRWEKSGSASKEVLVYVLAELMTPSTTYTLKIHPSIRDSQGNKIIMQPFELSFAENSWTYLLPTFGESGQNIQVVDANGTRQVQFAGGDDQTNFVAYPFDLIDFARLYADHYHFRGWGNNVRDIPIPEDVKPAASWKNFSTREVTDGRIDETTLPPDLAPGLYILNMRNGKILYDQLFLVVTRNTLVVKHDGDDLFVWLTNIHGENVPDAEIRLYSANGEKVREGKTDENGQYRVSIPEGVEPMLVSARVNAPDLSGDVALAGFDGWVSDLPSYYYYRWNYDYLPEAQSYLAYTYTERPIYRPGQVVNFKAIIRKDNDARYELPNEGMPVKIRVLDARGNAIETMELRTNRFGSVNGAVAIAEGALLGDYQIETNVAGVTTSQIFKVEDYRKPDYQVKLTTLQPEKENKFVQGDEMKVRINASYYFGEPLANVNLKVEFYHRWQVKSQIKGSLVTDENGETTLTFPAPYDPDYHEYYWDSNPTPQAIRMEVTANDGSNQTVTGVYQFLVYPASEQLDLETGGYFVQPGKTFTVTAKALDLFDQPVTGRKLSLTTTSWNGDTYEFDRAGQTLLLQTDANGIARQDVQLSAGYHRLTLSGKDPQGHKMEVSGSVYVFSSKDDWVVHSRDEFLTISAEKDSYKPYDTARLMIESTFSGPALLTFERGSIINTKMIELTAPMTIVETGIIPEHAPNVYVTVNAWQAGSQEVGRNKYWYYNETYADSYLRLATTEIQVDSTTKALDVHITTDKQIYQPGETLSAVIQVKDSTGKPVPAELSLAVVDEAIYGLSDDLAEDIFDAFYGPRDHTIITFDSMSPYRIIMVPGMGGGGGDEMLPAARNEFLDTSAWLPVIETDTNGQATVSIDLPDNTTSWRLSVKAVTLNHQVGQTEANVETKKDVFVRPVLPRVLTNGDQATLTAFVHNYSDKVQTVTVSLSAPGLEIRSQNDEQITVQPGKVRPLGWRVQAQSAKPTEVTITVRGATDILDAVILPLALQPAAIKDVQNQSGQFSGTLTLALPVPEIERETSEVRLTLNRSMSGTLLSGLEYLTGYPYGCVEQTMSRALPNAVVGRAANQLGLGGAGMQTRLEPLIKASIQRLYGLQHSDGGWGWWTDDVSDPYQTAWVLFGLGVMDNSGYPIEPKVMDQAAEWLHDNAVRNTELDIRTRVYALYSMAQAGRGDLEKTKELVDASIYELDPFSQAALALAMNRLGEKEQAQAILDILSESALKEDEYVSWPQPSYDGEYHSKTMASSVRTTALVLLAYAEIEPRNELVPGIVKYLADQRQGIYGWGTTNETSFTILGLTEYLVQEQNKAGNTPYEILVNGKSLVTGILEAGAPSASLDIPLTDLQDGLNTLVVTTQDADPVYFDLSTRYDLLTNEIEAAGNIQIKRRYLDPKTKEPIEQFKAGQLVRVELRVSAPQDAFFLAVEDYLPGGFEALNEGLSATNEVDPVYWEDYRPFFWQDYGYNYKEIRGDRVVFFITNFSKGTHTFTYYARMTTTGQFMALPAQAYAMYDLSLWGRSESSNVKIDK